VISIDDVEDLGVFVEIERVVSTESEIESVRNELFKLADSLGLDPTQSIRESYLELLLAQ
jgi:adenylate cyclase class 2